MGINMYDMKQRNADTVLWALRSCKTSTTKDLAQMTGLSFATVANLLNNFIESGEVKLGEQFSATGGRPSQEYIFNAEYAHVLAISARVQSGKNIIRACIANLYGRIIWQTEQCFDNIQLTCFEDRIDLCLHAYSTIRILSFSLPGTEHNGRIITNDYKELEGIFFTGHFQNKYQMPVVLENDVNMAVFGYGKGMKSNSNSAIVGIYFPRSFNPGAGIMIDGKILKGTYGYAGEVAYLPLGIEWVKIDYENPQVIGPAIIKLISTFVSIINPNDVVLYGDFFTDALKQTIERIIPTQDIGEIFPFISYRSDLDSDIISGLIIQAISAYESGLHLKYQQSEKIIKNSGEPI